ncbi:GNAT family N-acetyltransferase [Candidimonas nitroreducens]|uniref:GNAT family N-acetyltransferase n=1 Tax=Candidimonas nitroreducens TaxID=683354 RepID=A0A225M6C3_9BURK|nr:GNAT family N-acetyltransferase [Candidimonas nitroreducens]OWT56828.1 GNAT family N-acetyltransferase [Candidimonas nitroreducens]
MTDYSSLFISALDGSHERSGFHCGVTSLDNYLHKQARQDMERRTSRVFVATTPANPHTIVGYYTLSTLSMELDQLPDRIARKLPRHPIPAALLGRLAVDHQARGHGVGRMLLVNAIQRTLAVSDQIAIYAMIVDAIDDQARSFYEQFGFSLLGSGSHRRLFLPLKSV